MWDSKTATQRRLTILAFSRDNESRGRCGHTVVQGHPKRFGRRGFGRALLAEPWLAQPGKGRSRAPGDRLQRGRPCTTPPAGQPWRTGRSTRTTTPPSSTHGAPTRFRVPRLQPDPGGSAPLSPPLCVHPPQHPRRPEASAPARLGSTATRFPTSPSWRTRPGSPRPLRHLAGTGGLPLRRHDPVAGGFSEASSKGFSHAPPS